MSIPLAKAFWPVVISSTNNVIPIFSGGSISARTIAAATYYSAETLRAAVLAGITGAFSGTWSVTVSATGRFAITNNSLSGWKLYWLTSPTNIAGAILGYDTTADLTATGSGPYSATAPYQHQYGWYSSVAVFTDTGDRSNRDADRMTVSMAGQNKQVAESELTTRLLLWSYLAPAKTFIASEGATPNEAMQRWWRDGSARFRYWPDGTVEGTSADYFLQEETAKRFEPTRFSRGKELYSFEMKLGGRVA